MNVTKPPIPHDEIRNIKRQVVRKFIVLASTADVDLCGLI